MKYKNIYIISNVSNNNNKIFNEKMCKSKYCKASKGDKVAEHFEMINTILCEQKMITRQLIKHIYMYREKERMSVGI